MTSIPDRRRANLKEEVAQEIRDMILSGALRPRQRLDQDTLSERFGVSRMPLREALIQLESEGLITSVARHGSYVAPLQPDDIMDHYGMYGLLSGLAAERAAVARDPELIGKLEGILAAMRETDDPREHDRLNFSFHQAINRAGGSGRLLVVLRLLSNSMPSHHFEHSTHDNWQEQSVAEHSRILQCVIDGNGEGIAKELKVHFRRTGEQAVARLRSLGFWNESEGAS